MARGLLLLAPLLAAAGPAAAVDEPITFSVIGDVPYAESELTKLQQHVANHNLYSPSEFLAHVGDIFGESEACFEARYAAVAGILTGLAVPVYLVPGDNEWNDCASPAQGWAWWTAHLMRIEEEFCGTPDTQYQAVRPENFAFVSKGVLFMGINLVGGSSISKAETKLRLQQDADWVDQQLQQRGDEVRAAVLFAQAGPHSKRQAFFDRFVPAAAAFGKPVLLAQGDGHAWLLDRPFSAQNVERMQVERGTKPPVQVTVTLDPQVPFVYVRAPWPSGAQPLNRPPCVEAGPDLVVPFGESAALDAFVTDDGDPPGTLMTSWTWLDGPGAVTFAEPQAVSTTAGFDAPGVYSLRATASDGQLSRSDELSVDVRADAPLLTIDDVFATEGDPATFTVSLLEGGASPVSVDWSSVEGTAVAGVDYQAASGTLALSGAAPSQTLSVPGIDDGSHEESETFSVRLTNPVGAELLKAEGVAVVLDDDPALQQLTVGVEGDGGVLLAPPGGVYEQGTVVTLTAQPGPGFVFAGWSGHLAGSANPASIAMEADRAVTAHFTAVETFTLGVTAVGSGSVALDPPGGVYPSGTVVTLTPTPDPGSTFVGWGGALAGSASPTTLLMGSHRVVTASFEPVGASVALQEVATGGASLSFVVATSTSLAAASGDLYLAAVAFRPHGSVTGVSGLGLGWTQVAAQCGARSQTGLSLWKAQGAPSGSGIVTATFSTAPLNTVIAVARYSGVSLSGALGGAVPANQLGIAGACQGGVDAASYTFPLTTTAADSLVFAATAMRTRTHSPGAGYSERAEVRAGSGGDVASIALEDKSVAVPSATTVNGTFSGTADWASLAVEIRRATGAPAP
jgi:uncharacterized repeat protein (TIGR02543 family)